jgi:hypothetical protein
VAVIRLRLGDCGVLCLGDWFGDSGNARGHASCDVSDRHDVRDDGRLDADIVDQSSGCDHFSDSFLWWGLLVQCLLVLIAEQKLTATRNGRVLGLFRGAETGGGRGVRSTEGHRHGRGVGRLDLVGLGGDYWVVALVRGQNLGCDRLVGRVSRPA